MATEQLILKFPMVKIPLNMLNYTNIYGFRTLETRIYEVIALLHVGLTVEAEMLYMRRVIPTLGQYIDSQATTVFDKVLHIFITDHFICLGVQEQLRPSGRIIPQGTPVIFGAQTGNAKHFQDPTDHALSNHKKKEEKSQYILHDDICIK